MSQPEPTMVHLTSALVALTADAFPPRDTGSYTIEDLLAARHQSAAEFGLETIQEVLQRDVEAHNMIVEEMLGDLSDTTTERQRKYGTSVGGDMHEVDEHGRAPTERQTAGATVGFPLRQFQFALGWTGKWFEQNTPADMAQATQAAEKAHLRRIQREIQRAVFLSSNYTFTDFLVDEVDLSVLRLVNADGADIPDGPNGEEFDGSSHTHYLAVDGLDQDTARDLIQDIVEHGHGQDVKVVINRADEAAWRGLADFQEYRDPRLILGTEEDKPRQRADITRLDNRAIGIFDAAEIQVKPWGIADYAFCYSAGVEDDQRTLALRQRTQQSLQGLRFAAEINAFPLHAEYMEAEFGFGVWNRTNGAVLYTGGAAYVDPTL